MDKKTCLRCKKEFTKKSAVKFCSWDCYIEDRLSKKPCKDCGARRCPKHEQEKQRNWRATATKKERKARSLQGSYRQASGHTRTLSLDKARELIDNPPQCIYCEKPIDWSDLSIDHMQPVSRGGSNEDDNLVWVHKDCNMIKGSLTFDEFIDLLSIFRKHPDIEKYLVPRLKSGGGAIYGRN